MEARGRITGTLANSDADVFRVPSPTPVALQFELVKRGTASCADLTGVRLQLLDGTGTPKASVETIALGACRRLVVSVGTGTWYLSLSRSGPGAAFDYELSMTSLGVPSLEVEPNDSISSATVIPSTGGVVCGAFIANTLDSHDHFVISLPAGARRLTAEVIDTATADVCWGGFMALDLLTSSGTVLEFDADSGRLSCPLIERSSLVSPGTYVLNVRTFSTSRSFSYCLAVVPR